MKPTVAFPLQVSVVISVLAASSALTPLYASWQARWGFSPLTVTVIFAVYAVAVLAALLVFGSLSDHVGRKPVLLTALAAQLASFGVFALAPDVATLIAGRALQGLSAGAAVAALGATLLDLDRQRGPVANAVAPMTGTGVGSVASALMVQWVPAPTTWVFVGLATVLTLQLVGVALTSETAARRAGAWASLVPQLRLPASARPAFILAVPALIAAWAVPGFYGSLGPAVVRGLTGSNAPVFAGLPLFVMALSGAVAVLFTLDRPAQRVLVWGSAGLAVGIALTLVGISQASLPIFAIGAIVGGAGFGLAFNGSIRAVVPTVLPHERAGTISMLLIVAYLSLGVPAVLAGLRVASAGVTQTALEFGAVVILLAALSFARALVPSAPLPSLPVTAERKTP